MLVVETIGKIRRAYFVQGKPIKAICRELRVSRKVVRKVLRSGATSFEYEREVQPLPKIGPWAADLERILEGNAAKPSRERLTLMRVFEELRGLGHHDGYDTVRRYARCWHSEQAATPAAAFVPLGFAPGPPVRLEPRGRADQRHDKDREGRPCPALPHHALDELRSCCHRLLVAARPFRGDPPDRSTSSLICCFPSPCANRRDKSIQ